MTQTDQWLAWLQSKLGVHEIPNGSNLTPIGEEFGWNGVAWCCETQSLAALYTFGRRVLWTAGVADGWARARNGENGMKALPANTTIQVGDLPCYDFKGHGRPADMHIGGVVNPGTQDRFETIEGNLGNRVQRLWRDRTYVYGFIRLPFASVGLGASPRRSEDVNYFMQEEAAGSTKDDPKGKGLVFKLNGFLQVDREYTTDGDRDDDMYLCNVAGTRAPVPADAQQITVPQGVIQLVEPGFRAKHKP